MKPTYQATLAVAALLTPLLVGSVLVTPVSAQVAARPRPTIGMPPSGAQSVPPVIRQGALGNRASRLEPTPYLQHSDFRALIGVVGTPNDFEVPSFATSFKISPLAPNVSGKGALATRDVFSEPDYTSEIIGGAAVINHARRVSYTYATSFDGIHQGGAELTINALRGEVYAVNCLASVNGNPNAVVYYRTSNPMGTGPLLPEASVALKNHHFVTLVRRSSQNGEIKIFLRPEAVILPASGMGASSSMGGLSRLASSLERAQMTPEERAAEDAAEAAKAAAPPPPPVRHTLKLWGCQISSAN
jgi:hypothetical protein